MNNVREFPFGKIYTNWDVVPIPQYVYFQEGPGLRTLQWTKNGMKVINVKNILLDGTINVDNTDKYISLDEFNKKYSHFAVQKGDIVVSSSGWSYGKVGRIQQDHLPLMMNTSVIRFRPLTDEFDADYLFNFLRSEYFLNQIEMFISGVQQPNFGPVHIKRMQIIKPPLPIQRRIANILSTYDDLIENNTRRIRILEGMAQAIYQECFGMVDKGSLPEGWEVIRLGELIDFAKGKKPKETSPNGEMPLLLIDSIQSGISEFTNDSNVVITEIDDIVMVMDGASSGRVFHGQYGALGSTLGRYRPKDKEKFSQYHFYFFILANLKQITDNNIGASIPHANKDFINQLDVCLPPRETERQFHEQMYPVFDLIRILQNKNSNLRRTRDLLLSRLVSGEVEV